MFDFSRWKNYLSTYTDRLAAVAQTRWFRVLAAIALVTFLLATILNQILAAQLAPYTVTKLPEYSAQTTTSSEDADDDTPPPSRWSARLDGRCFFGCPSKSEEEKNKCPDGCPDGKECKEGECVPVEDEEPDKPKSDVPVESEIDVKLLGCMVAQDPRYSMALVQGGKSEESYVVSPGDMLPQEARVLKIERDRIFIMRDGQKEYIQLAESIGGDPNPVSISKPNPRPRSAGGDTSDGPQNEDDRGGAKASASVDKKSSKEYTVPKEKLEKKLDNPRDLAQEVRVLPNYENEDREGLKMVGVSPSGIFSELGFESGDVVHSVGGEELTSQKDAMEMLERLRSKESVDVTVERDGERVERQYNLK